MPRPSSRVATGVCREPAFHLSKMICGRISMALFSVLMNHPLLRHGIQLESIFTGIKSTREMIEGARSEESISLDTVKLGTGYKR